MKPPILNLFNKLLNLYGAQGWWPLLNIEGSNPTKSGSLQGYHPGDYSYPRNRQQQFQIIVGAVLTQNTSWVQVERGLVSLQKNELLSPTKLTQNPDLTKACIRVCGYYNQKFDYLKSICKMVQKLTTKGDLWVTPSRQELLSLKGVGPETADTMLCYAFSQKQFIVDAYTRRVFQRIGWIEPKISYNKLKNLIESCLPDDLIIYQEFHALIVEFAKRLKVPTSSENDLLNEICGQ